MVTPIRALHFMRKDEIARIGMESPLTAREGI
jgi:hypothetical protein